MDNNDLNSGRPTTRDLFTLAQDRWGMLSSEKFGLRDLVVDIVFVSSESVAYTDAELAKDLNAYLCSRGTSRLTSRLVISICQGVIL